MQQKLARSEQIMFNQWFNRAPDHTNKHKTQNDYSFAPSSEDCFLRAFFPASWPPKSATAVGHWAASSRKLWWWAFFSIFRWLHLGCCSNQTLSAMAAMALEPFSLARCTTLGSKRSSFCKVQLGINTNSEFHPATKNNIKGTALTHQSANDLKLNKIRNTTQPTHRVPTLRARNSERVRWAYLPWRS